MSDGRTRKSRVFSDIGSARRPGFRWPQELPDVRAIYGSSKRQMRSRFHSPLRLYYRVTLTYVARYAAPFHPHGCYTLENLVQRLHWA